MRYIEVYRMIKQAADEVQRPAFHTVVSGDNFSTLGRKYGVSAQRFMAANPGVDPKTLREGQQLNVPPSDRDDIIQNYGFDPDVVNMPSPMLIWQQMMQESTLGQKVYPKTAPGEVNTSVGHWQPNKSAWDTVSKLYPDYYNGRKMSEMATDLDLSYRVYHDYMTELGKRWQYKNKKPVTGETLVRSWNAPADPYGAQGTKYWNAVTRHTLPAIHNALQKSPDNVYFAAYGKHREQP